MLVYDEPLPSTPCNWDVDTSCCTDWDTYSDALQTAAAEYGAMVMWAATGRRFGLCERTVRPCGRTRDFIGTPAGYYWAEGTWIPYIFNGVWRNCANCVGASYGCCTCEPDCQVYLQGPVHSIPATGISLDGEIVDVDAWRVDNGQWLVRTDGDCWPTCQDYNVDSGTGMFQVTYFIGQEVPSVVLSAAGRLACEYAKSCLGADCQLPARMTSISRQGVSVSLVDVDVMLKNGLTGILTVDQVIRSFNPYGLTSKMKVASPDWPPVTRVTTYP